MGKSIDDRIKSGRMTEIDEKFNRHVANCFNCQEYNYENCAVGRDWCAYKQTEPNGLREQNGMVYHISCSRTEIIAAMKKRSPWKDGTPIRLESDPREWITIMRCSNQQPNGECGGHPVVNLNG